MSNQNAIIEVSETHLTLPSKSIIALDAIKTFAPNQEFWSLWREDKIGVKRCGIGVTIEKSTGEYRGFVREGAQGFGYTQSEIHAYWVQKSQEKADNSVCAPVIIDYSELTRPRPRMSCVCFEELEVVAKRCKNGTWQLRVKCTACGARTQNAIAWDRLGSEFVISSIAYAIQQNL